MFKQIMLAVILLAASISPSFAKNDRTALCGIQGILFEIRNIEKIQYYDAVTRITLMSNTVIDLNGINNFCLF